MQDFDLPTRLLVYAAAIGIPLMALLCFVRIIQLLILYQRERVPLLTWKPDFPGLRRWQHVNGVLFGSICFVGSLAGAAFFAWCSWEAFRKGDTATAWLVAFMAGFTLLCAIAFGVYPVWRSLRQRPWD